MVLLTIFLYYFFMIEILKIPDLPQDINFYFF